MKKKGLLLNVKEILCKGHFFSKGILFFIIIFALYFIAYIFNLFYITFIFGILYEIFFSIFILFLELLPTLTKASIIYLIFYFLFCMFNVKYFGYKKYTFFGILLDNYKNVWIMYLYLIKEYNYFILVILHIILLNIIIHFIYDNIIIVISVLLFYIMVYLSIKMKVIWSGFDSNYKMKIWNFSFNIVLALVLGFYINLIVEYLAPLFFFKISGSEYFWKSFQLNLIKYHR